MPRPKSILWVDDEVDGLAAHRKFLEQQGFAVAQAAHGDDALAMLRRQPYSVVLLDEQMPGRRGLDLLPEIRAIDPAMAVVMVTQSEDDALLRDAIGTEIDDYLVKPVHPRQVLSVVTRLLEGDRIRQQRLARDMITPLFDVEESHYYSILPTATPFSRNAIFSGMFPMEIAARHPDWWGAPSDEESLNAHEAELLTEQLRELVGEEVPVRYEKLFTAADGADLLRRLPAHLAQPGVTALVFNFIDQLTHGRSENAILYEVARDADALRGLTKTWFERSPVLAALEEAERRNVPVLLTTDHGAIHCHTPATVFAKRDATANLRYKFGEDLRAEDPEAAITVEDLKSYGLPAKGLGVRLLLATGDRFFVYPTKLREYQARYRGAFLHGGATPEEMILPVALRNVVIVLLVALLLKNLTSYLASLGSVSIQEGVVRDLRIRLFRHLQTLPLGYFQRTRAGQTIARVISDTDQVKTAVSASLASLLQNVVVIIVYIVILFGLSVKLALLSLLLAPVLLLIIRPMINRLRRRSRELAAERGEVTSQVGEMIASAKLVRAYVAEAIISPT